MEGYTIDKNLLTFSELQAVIAGLRSLDSISDNKKYRINLASWYKASLAPKIGLIQAAIEARKRIDQLRENAAKLETF